MLHNTKRTAREITAKLMTRVEFWTELKPLGKSPFPFFLHCVTSKVRWKKRKVDKKNKEEYSVLMLANKFENPNVEKLRIICIV